MKKSLTLMLLIFSMFLFVSCAADEEEEDTNEAADTGSDSDTAADSNTDSDTAADSAPEAPDDSSDTQVNPVSDNDPSPTTDNDPNPVPDNDPNPVPDNDPAPSTDNDPLPDNDPAPLPDEDSFVDCGAKICGDDGFGNSCGMCGYKERCSIDQTQCISCSCEGRVCGTDGCGGGCGQGNGVCPSGEKCTADGQCVVCSCDGKTCGDNGCGHSCGDCRSDESCSADQTQCIKCSEITLSDLVQTAASDPANRFFDYTAEYSPNGGSSKNHFSLQIYHNPNNCHIDFSRQTFDTCTLDKPTNEDGICAFIKEYDGEIIDKLYFPQSGVIKIPNLNNNGSFNDGVLVNNPILVEIDKTTGVPVPGGKCFKIKGDWIKAKAK